MTSEFWVPGIPAPKGSTKAFYVKSLGRPVVTTDNERTEPWEQAVRLLAAASGLRACSKGVSVSVDLTFLFPRPKSHFGAKGLRPSAPSAMTTKPDIDKLERTVLDALTGIAYVDDSQVCEVRKRKRYVGETEVPGAWVRIERPL